MVCAILITEDASCELLHLKHGQGFEHDLMEPVHEVCLSNQTKLLWSSRYQCSKVNEFASRAVGERIVGDAFLLSDLLSSQECMQHMLTMSRQLAPIHAALKPGPSWPMQPWGSLPRKQRPALPAAAAAATTSQQLTATAAAATISQQLSVTAAAAAATTTTSQQPGATPAATTATITSQMPSVTTAKTPVTAPAAGPQQPSATAAKQPTAVPAATAQLATVTTAKQQLVQSHLSTSSVKGWEGHTNVTTAHGSIGAKGKEGNTSTATAAGGAGARGREGNTIITTGGAAGGAGREGRTIITTAGGGAGGVGGAAKEGHTIDITAGGAGGGNSACWQDLGSGLLAHIALLLPPQASYLLPIMQVCSAWRQALLSHNLIIKHAWFLLDPHRPLRGSDSPAPRLAPAPAHNTAAPPAFTRRMLPPKGRSSGGGGDLAGSEAGGLGPLVEAAAAAGTAGVGLGVAGPGAGAGTGAGSPRGAGASGVDGPLGRAVRARDAAVAARAATHLRAALPYLPRLMQAGVRQGNVSAMACMAQLLEVVGHEVDALKLWRKCAKAGDAEACLRLGMACYVGAPGVVLDSEAAQSWLSKGLKRVMGVTQLSAISVDLTLGVVMLQVPDTPASDGSAPAGGGSSTTAAVGGGTGGPQGTRRLTATLPEFWTMRGQRARTGPGAAGATGEGAADQDADAGDRDGAAVAAGRRGQAGGSSGAGGSGRAAGHSGRAGGAGGGEGGGQKVVAVGSMVPGVDYEDPQLQPMVACAAVMLGYIQFDGEGSVRTDRAHAVTLFKLAALAGSREAARILGWIFSTGQYGL